MLSLLSSIRGEPCDVIKPCQAASTALVMAGVALLPFALAIPAAAAPITAPACRHHLYTVDSYSDQVSVIDTNTNAVTATIKVGKAPAWTVFTPDKKQLYVSNSGESSISVIDVETNAVVSTLATGAKPIGVVFTPDGSKLVVSYISGSMQIFSVATGQPGPVIQVGLDPEQIRMTPGGRYVYAASTLPGAIYKLDVSTGRIVAIISIKDPNGGFLPFPYNLIISRDGSRIYVANTLGGFISEIDTRTDTVTRTFSALGPVGLQLSKDGTKLYVTNFWTAGIDEYDLGTGNRTRTSTLTGIWWPSHLVESADGRTLYFGQSFDTKLLVFDAVSWKPVTTVQVGVGPNSVAICNSASPR